MSTSMVRRVVLVAGVFALLLPGSVFAQQYHRTDLTTDASAVSPSAANLDPNLVNAWGLARGTGSPWWVADNGPGLSTLYNAAGAPLSLVVTIPTPDGTGSATPSGTVFNATPGFLVAPNAKAAFLFVTEDGTISGWNPTVNLTKAVLLKNRAGKAIYKGCAIAQVSSGPRFYATNFQSGRVEVFNSSFHRFESDDDAFRFPGLDNNWAPFNIQNVGGNLIVSFVHRAPGSHDEDHGAGLGFVGVYDPRGHLLLRLQHGSWFNAPWGIASAPGDFGKFSHRLLIGNFGDGTIHAFNLFTGKHEGAMIDDTTGQPLSVDGLWAISFGGGSATNNGPTNTLFFTAGPNDEGDGLFGQIAAAAADQPGNSQ
jgi:uncharacterized protein (TIGR03118 family)